MKRKDTRPAEGKVEVRAPEDAMNSLWSQMSGAWTGALAPLSAWIDTISAVQQNRGVPAAAKLLGTLFSPDARTGNLAPLLDDIQNLFALPRFADLPSLNAGALPSFAPAVELMVVAQQYLIAVVPAINLACKRFQSEISALRQGGEHRDDAGAALDLWNSILDKTLMEFNRSREFGELQRRFLHATMQQRLEVRKLAEKLAEATDSPTRTEMIDVYQRLHVLRREVHELRRELRASKPAAKPPAAMRTATRKVGRR